MNSQPELSIAIPLYNEAENVESLTRGLAAIFANNGITCEIILVNNGSQDETGSRIDVLAQQAGIRAVHLSKNQGYGGGVLAGLACCEGKFVGYTSGDNQVSPEDHLRVFQKLKNEDLDLCKGHREIRHDGLVRKVVTRLYNLLFQTLFPVSVGDINSPPKLMKGEKLRLLDLRSRDWFLDPELIIKAGQKKFRMGEVGLVFLPRLEGSSNVRFGTAFEFGRNLLLYRLGLHKDCRPARV